MSVHRFKAFPIAFFGHPAIRNCRRIFTDVYPLVSDILWPQSPNNLAGFRKIQVHPKEINPIFQRIDLRLLVQFQTSLAIQLSQIAKELFQIGSVVMDDVAVIHVPPIILASLLVFDVMVNIVDILYRKDLAGLISNRRADLHLRHSRLVAKYDSASAIGVNRVIAPLFTVVGTPQDLTAHPDGPVIKTIAAHICGNGIMGEIVEELSHIYPQDITLRTMIDIISSHILFKLVQCHVLAKAFPAGIVIINQMWFNFLPKHIFAQCTQHDLVLECAGLYFTQNRSANFKLCVMTHLVCSVFHHPL